MDGDFVALSVHLLDRGVVGVLMRDEERGFDVAAIRILALAVEDILVETNVIVVDGIVEGNRDHLRHVLTREIAGNRGTVLRAEAIGQNAHSGITWRSSIGIVVHV